MVVGKALKKYNIPRNKVVILTKCWAPVSEHDNDFIYQYWEELRGCKDYVNQFGKSHDSTPRARELHWQFGRTYSPYPNRSLTASDLQLS